MVVTTKASGPLVGLEEYLAKQQPEDQAIMNALTVLITFGLKDSVLRIWHRHPVWFLNGNPIVGFSREKRGTRLMFWSGADFDESKLNVRGGKFKDASIFYRTPKEIDAAALLQWLEKSRHIQWDYQNIVKRKGVLVRIDTNPSNE